MTVELHDSGVTLQCSCMTVELHDSATLHDSGREAGADWE